MFFKSSNLERVRFREKQDELKLRTLVLPGDTRWGSLLKCFITLLASKSTLEDYTNDGDFISRGADRQAKEKRGKSSHLSTAEILTAFGQQSSD